MESFFTNQIAGKKQRIFNYYLIFKHNRNLFNQIRFSDNLVADVFSILSHLSRKSEDVVITIIKILKGSSNGFQILVRCLNGNPIIKSRCCNMIGNLMKHNDLFYDILKKNKLIFENLIKCCQLDEFNVRKVYCIQILFLC